MCSGERRPRHRRRCRHGCGIAYLALLLALALMSLAASASLSLGATLARRDAELQLLAVGQEFQAALRSYANLPRDGALPLGARGPRTLEELLHDPRAPGVRRHLRQVYADPLTGRREWGIVRDGEGFILGVHSLAKGRPIKQAGFEAGMERLEQATSYGDWMFGLAITAAGARATPRTGDSRR